MRFSIGLNVSDSGTMQEVMWDSAAFQAGLTTGALIQSVDGEAFSAQAMGDAIEKAQGGSALCLMVRSHSQSRLRNVTIDYRDGHRYPHLERLPGTRARLDEIFTARL